MAPACPRADADLPRIGPGDSLRRYHAGACHPRWRPRPL